MLKNKNLLIFLGAFILLIIIFVRPRIVEGHGGGRGGIGLGVGRGIGLGRGYYGNAGYYVGGEDSSYPLLPLPYYYY